MLKRRIGDCRKVKRVSSTAKLLEEWPDTGTIQVEALLITLKFLYLFLALCTISYLHNIVFAFARFSLIMAQAMPSPYNSDNLLETDDETSDMDFVEVKSKK